jgi:hypothetical protein
MKIGITGTKKGLSEKQRKFMESWCQRNNKSFDEFHHGDCIGVDSQVHDILTDLGWKAVIHPPNIYKYRAFKEASVVHKEKPYLKRNKNIVDSVDVVYAFPLQEHEVIRSGTWATIRYAAKQDKPLWIVLPNGKLVQIIKEQNATITT